MAADCGVDVADVACCCVSPIAVAVSVARAAGGYVHCIVANTPALLVFRTAPKYDGAGRSVVDIVAGGFDGDVAARAGAVVVMVGVMRLVAAVSARVAGNNVVGGSSGGVGTGVLYPKGGDIVFHGSNVGKQGIQGSSKSGISCVDEPECHLDRSIQHCC